MDWSGLWLEKLYWMAYGWLTVAVLATTLANLRLRISKNIYKARMVSAEENAVTWKRQAGKAYTELLKTRSGTDNAATLIPVGSRIDCTMKTSTVNSQQSLNVRMMLFIHLMNIDVTFIV